MRHLRLIACLALFWAAEASFGQSQLPVVLTFDGAPLRTRQSASFSCFDYSDNRWVGCRVREFKQDGGWRLEMERPRPGRYRIHVDIDENLENPGGYPGDFEAISNVAIAATAPETLRIAMERLIHLKAPRNNGRSLPGAFAACEREAEFEAPLLSLRRKSRIPFAWSPVSAHASYQYAVYRGRCDPYARLEPIVQGSTDVGVVELALPPNGSGEHYQFVVEAFHEEQRLGFIKIHDGGGYGWDYRFRVGLEEPDTDMVFVAALAAVLIFFVTALGFMLVNRKWGLAAVCFVTVAGLGWVEHRLYRIHEEEHRSVEAELILSQREAARLQEWLDQSFLEEWISTVPRPEWWDSVETPSYPIENVGDLLSFWQSDRDDNGNYTYVQRQFFKTAYEAIATHPGDDHLVSTAIDLMAFVGRDYKYRQEMLELAVDRFFELDRDDRCANCKIGDRTNSLVEALSQSYLSENRFEDVITLVERVRRERRDEISHYAWAETARHLGEAYWETGRKADAIEVVVEAMEHRELDHPSFDRLDELLERWQSPAPIPPRPAKPTQPAGPAD